MSDREASPPRDVLQLLGRLQRACAHDAPISILPAHATLSCTGRLASASVDGVGVELPNPPEIEFEGALLEVTFPEGSGTAGFSSTVVRTTAGEDAITLVLTLPEQIRQESRRAAVRVPVPRGTVETTIVEGSGRGTVVPIDISLLGMLIEVDEEQRATLKIGDGFWLRLSLGRMQLLVEVEVRREEGRRLGLRFRWEGPPPKQMGKIMWKIQEKRRRASM